MKITKDLIGKRIIWHDKYAGDLYKFQGQKGTIVDIYPPVYDDTRYLLIAIDWDYEVFDIIGRIGHTCYGKAREKHGWNSLTSTDKYYDFEILNLNEPITSYEE